jgi:hypothetical protein
VSVEPKAKRSACSYLNISWVQHIDILPTAQVGIVPGAETTLDANLGGPLLPKFVERVATSVP